MPDVFLEFVFKMLVPGDAGFQNDEGVNRIALDLVGQTDSRGFGNIMRRRLWMSSIPVHSRRTF
jgi:hypothetical protein